MGNQSTVPLSTGTYQVISELGEGGFAKIFRVKKNDQEYALKIMNIQTKEHEKVAANELKILVSHFLYRNFERNDFLF